MYNQFKISITKTDNKLINGSVICPHIESCLIDAESTAVRLVQPLRVLGAHRHLGVRFILHILRHGTQSWTIDIFFMYFADLAAKLLPWLTQCFANLRVQTYAQWQIIFIVKGIATKNPRIKFAFDVPPPLVSFEPEPPDRLSAEVLLQQTRSWPPPLVVVSVVLSPSSVNRPGIVFGSLQKKRVKFSLYVS